jgi:hypothetical protein
MDLTHAFPTACGGMKKLEELRGNDRRILLGVTGGIASGKSTVARMLESWEPRSSILTSSAGSLSSPKSPPGKRSFPTSGNRFCFPIKPWTGKSSLKLSSKTRKKEKSWRDLLIPGFTKNSYGW